VLSVSSLFQLISAQAEDEIGSYSPISLLDFVLQSFYSTLCACMTCTSSISSQDDMAFQKQSALFALAISDIVLINM
jgi:hypothetical protein